MAAGFDGRPRDVIVLPLERPGGVNQHVHAELAKQQPQARVVRIDTPGGVGGEAELVRESRGLGEIPAGEDELHARIARQARGNAAAKETVGAEQQNACAGFGHISEGYADKL